MTRRLLPALLAVASLLVLAPAASAARGGDDDGRRGEVRTTGSCGGGAVARLRLKADDGRIELRFEVQRARRGVWRVTIVQESRIAWRGSARSTGGFAVRRRIADFSGADRVMVRGLGPRGVTCVASATLPG